MSFIVYEASQLTGLKIEATLISDSVTTHGRVRLARLQIIFDILSRPTSGLSVPSKT